MGIVIINGKRYDSVTGLMIADDSATANEQVQQSFDTQTPDWIASYVDEVKHEASSSHAEQTTDTENSNDDTVTADIATPVVTPTRTTGQVTRRTASPSHTLNRRFVKKPLAEDGNYAESLAERHIKLTQQAKQATMPIDIPEDTQLNAANEANEDFVPMLTKRQAEGVNKLNNAEPLEVRVKKTEAERDNATHITTKAQQENSESADIAIKVKPAIRLTPTRQSISDDDILNERLSQLSQILQNAKELDEQERNSKSARKQTLTDQLVKTNDNDSDKVESKHGRRKFRLSTIFATAGAMAVVAGLGIYMAMPTISVKMAASKAGLTTNTPYIPSGFTIDGEVASADGHMTINYRSKNGGDGYSVTIKENDTDTQGSLRRRIADLYSNGYRTEQSGDKTLLRYDGKVTWLDDGIEYTINTNNYLDTDEITSIVDSL